MHPQSSPIALLEAAAARPDRWSPGVVGQLNDHFVKVARILGEFPWHAHTQQDEGTLRIGRSAADGGAIDVHAGEFFIVPRGVSHNTSTPTSEECLIALIEPADTLHTGDVQTPLTRSIAEQLGDATVIPE